MKLGSETNSVMNHLHSRATIGQPEPVIGMGVTFLGWTDRTPGTIIDVLKDKPRGVAVQFTAQEDTATRTDANGMSECQTYRYETNPLGVRRSYMRDRNGQWRQIVLGENGRSRFADKSQSIVLGKREKYYDFSF